MKHLFIALALLGAVLSCSIPAVFTVERCTNEIIQELELAQLQAEHNDFRTAYEQVLHAQALWQKRESLFGILLEHTETDEIRFQLAALEVCAEQPVREEFRYRCAELIARLEHIAEMEKPHSYNLL